MKKMSFILLLPLIVGVGCTKSNKEDFLTASKLTLITPTGAPTLAFVDYLESENYETNNNVANIAADMIAGNNDLAVMDLVGGLNAISKGAKYSLGAVLTFGNFYVYSTGNDDNEIMEEDDVILAFGNDNATPVHIFKDLYDLTIDLFVPGVSNTLMVGTTGKYNDENVDYILTAEPVLTNILKNTETGSIYSNLQAEWKEKHGQEQSILGAALFVKNDTYTNKKDKVIEFLELIEDRINKNIADPDSLGTILNKYDSELVQTKIELKTELAINVMKNNNSINLGYLDFNNELFVPKIESYLPIVKVNVPNASAYLN